MSCDPFTRPVNGIDPTGLQGAFTTIIGKLVKSVKVRGSFYTAAWALTKALIGLRASYVLGDAYIRENGRSPNDVQINMAIARKSDQDLPDGIDPENLDPEWSSRPDIVDLTVGKEAVYEIKSASLGFLGAIEVLAYQKLLDERYPGRSFTRGLWNPSRNPYSIGEPYGIPLPLTIQAWRHAPGVIVWESTGTEDAVLGAVIATEIIVHLVRGEIIVMAGSTAGANSARAQSAFATGMLLAVFGL